MAEVKVDVKVNVDGADKLANIDKGATGASEGIGKFGHSCDIAKGRAMEFVKGLVGFEELKTVYRGAKDLAGSFLDAANTTEKYRTRLEILLGSQEEGNGLFKEMSDYASRVPFEFEEIMGAGPARP